MRRLRDGVTSRHYSVGAVTRHHAGVLQSQAEIASFMEATLPQDKGDTLPASPIMDFEKGPEGLLYKDDVVGTGPSPTVGVVNLHGRARPHRSDSPAYLLSASR